MKYLVDTFNEQQRRQDPRHLQRHPGQQLRRQDPAGAQEQQVARRVLLVEAGFAEYIIDSGWAAPLDKYWKQYGWTKELTPAANDVATFDGHKYFLPYYMAASVLWYNTDLFKKYGIKPPKT